MVTYQWLGLGKSGPKIWHRTVKFGWVAGVQCVSVNIALIGPHGSVRLLPVLLVTDSGDVASTMDVFALELL